MNVKYKPKITILTDPIATGRWWLPQTLRVIARTLPNYIRASEKKVKDGLLRARNINMDVYLPGESFTIGQ